MTTIEAGTAPAKPKAKWSQSTWIKKVVKPIFFVAALIPAGYYGWAFYQDTLGPNPIDFVLNTMGLWTIRFVVLTLCVTPVRKLTGLNALIDMRRMIGLFAFFYGTLHFLAYAVLDQALALDDILFDIAKRPFIWVGFGSFVLMIPLAVTSTKGWIKRMGGKKWNLLHRLIYLTACGGVVHYYWRVKADVKPPLMYGGIVLVLFGIRAWYAYAKKKPKKVVAAAKGQYRGIVSRAFHLPDPIPCPVRRGLRQWEGSWSRVTDQIWV